MLKLTEFTKTLSRCQISADNVDQFEELVTRDREFAPTAWTFAQLILAKLKEGRKVTILEDSVAQDMAEANIEEFGKAGDLGVEAIPEIGLPVVNEVHTSQGIGKIRTIH